MSEPVTADIAARLDEVHAAMRARGHDPTLVTIIAVTKTHPLATVQAAMEAGLRIFGENRVQEAQQKIPPLTGSGAGFRLIGHLQANKARRAVELFDAIDTIDSPELAARVAHYAEHVGRAMPVLIEVNASGEKAKSGCAWEDLDALVELCAGQEWMRLEGLMAMGPLEASEVEVAACFRRVRDAFEAHRKHARDMRHCSLGMTADYLLALDCGSNMVRLGTALFGARGAQ